MLKSERYLPKHMQAMISARIKIMANLDITEHRDTTRWTNQDECRFSTD